MKDDFPIKPKLFGEMIPTNINLWMGASKKGTSSGLHHDFHDNLYVLIKGKKRFTIFPPSDANFLYTYGSISKIHPTGLINYDINPTRSDGALLRILLDYHAKVSQDLQKKSSRDKNNKQLKEQIKKEELKLKCCLDHFIDHKPFDEYQYSGVQNKSEGKEKDDKGEDSDENSINKDSDEDFFRMEMRDDYEDEEDKDIKNQPKNNIDDQNLEPPHFSRIDIPQLRKTHKNYSDIQFSEYIKNNFPSFRNATPISIDLNEGEMLYLPAGWFHEVLSLGGEKKDSVHMAFNYWFHPISIVADFQNPYLDQYWKDNFDSILRNNNLSPSSPQENIVSQQESIPLHDSHKRKRSNKKKKLQKILKKKNK